MPELPEVETMVRGIRPHIQGRTILEMEFCPCTRKPIAVTPAPRRFQKSVRNHPIVDVSRLAKRVVVTLEGHCHIVVEPRMTGLMLVTDPPTEEHRRVCWHLKPRRGMPATFEFWDRRGLGTVRLLSEEEMAALRARLGPDALHMTLTDWKEQLSKTTRAVKVAMLEQKLIAGIGNLYASEILHRAGVSPRKAANRVTRTQCERIEIATKYVLNEAIRYEGSTLGDGTYRNVLNQDGNYQSKHQVYQKAGEKCPTCETGTIRRIVQTQRSTFYCPRCQRG